MAQGSAELTLNECYTLSKQNYPLIKQQELILKSKEYSVQNAGTGYYPQVAIYGQATYQSDVISLPISIPGQTTPLLAKDQYKIYAEVNQPLYDGGMVRSQKRIQEAAGVIEEQKLEVELYKLKDRVNQLFFGVLLVDQQVEQIVLLKKDLQTSIAKTEASISNGVALKSNADVLKAEQLKANQRITELKAARKVYCEMLGMFINKPLDEKTKLVQPEAVLVSQTLNRPELLLFDQQYKTIDLQHQQLKAKNMPKFSLFAQGGYGRPALNPLNNKFDTYYLGGIRMNWSLTGFYTFKNDKALLDINRRNVEVQKELFVFNTNYALKQQNTEVEKYLELLTSDNEIITLRTAIKSRSSAQLENGVISASDYLRELNAEEQAKEAKILHEVQLLLARYNQQTTYGDTAKN